MQIREKKLKVKKCEKCKKIVISLKERGIVVRAGTHCAKHQQLLPYTMIQMVFCKDWSKSIGVVGGGQLFCYFLNLNGCFFLIFHRLHYSLLFTEYCIPFSLFAMLKLPSNTSRNWREWYLLAAKVYVSSLTKRSAKTAENKQTNSTKVFVPEASEQRLMQVFSFVGYYKISECCFCSSSSFSPSYNFVILFYIVAVQSFFSCLANRSKGFFVFTLFIHSLVIQSFSWINEQLIQQFMLAIWNNEKDIQAWLSMSSLKYGHEWVCWEVLWFWVLF